MNMNYILFGFVLFPLVYGMLLFHLKGDKLLWSASILGSLSMLLVSVVLLIQGDSLLFHIPLFSHFGIGLETSSLNLVLGVMTCLMWFISIVACQEHCAIFYQNLNRFYGSLFVVLSGTLGVFFAYDLLTLFVFFEIMSFTSYFWVVHKQSKEAIAASNLYLAFGVVGGLSILLGIFALTPLSMDLRISQLESIFRDPNTQEQALFACCFLTLGFGAKAGIFFLHDWSPPAYTQAPAPATALLSSILSKCGVYGMFVVMIKIVPDILGFSDFILTLSVLSMFMGGLSAFFSGNLKRTLAFSSISQVGFILWGTSLTNLLGDHNAYAGYGTIFHLINHSFIKILLFLLAGLVFQTTGTMELEHIKGYGRGKPWFQVLWTIGALSLAAVPLFPGYISKTLLHEAILEYFYFEFSTWFHRLYEWLFVISGGFTVAYMLKIYVCLFLEPLDTERSTQWNSQGKYATKKTLCMLTLIAGILVLLGLTPNAVFAHIGHYMGDFFHLHRVDSIDYYTFTNLKGSILSIFIGVGLYFFQKALLAEDNTSLYRELSKEDDNFVVKLYQPLLWLLSLVFGVIARLFDIACEVWILLISRGFFRTEEIPDTFFHGTDNQVKHKPMDFRITQSLAFSLLMFGLGFIFTIVYLLVVGGTLQLGITPLS